MAGLALAPAARGQDAAAPTGEKDDPARAAFKGRWTLNAALSEDAAQKMKEARAQAPGGGPGGGFGGRGGGWGRGGGGGRGGFGGGGRGGYGGGRGGREGDQGGGGPGGQRPTSFMSPPAEMTVTQLSPEIVVVEPDGVMRNLHPDGRKYQAEGGRSEVKVRWDGPQLVVETTTGWGSKVTETWSVDSAKHQLTVLRKLESRRMGTVSVRSVYDAADGAPPPASPAAPPAGSSAR